MTKHPATSRPLPAVDRLTAVWLLLLGLSALGLVLGERYSGRGVAGLVLMLALCKAQLLVDHFMGLRHAGPWWRGLMAAYLLFLGAVIGAAYSIW